MRKVLSAVLGLIFVFALMPLTTYAAENDVTNPNAAFVITDKNGNSIDLKFDFFAEKFTNFPNEGDKIKIFLDGKVDDSPDKEYTYHNETFDERGFYSPFRFEIKSGDYNSRKANISVNEVNDRTNYMRGYLYNINVSMPVSVGRAEMTRFEISPSLVNVDSETIKAVKADGSTFYNLNKRAVMSNGRKAAFADGDKAIVYFADGTAKVYTNQIKDGIDVFAASDGEYIEVLAKSYELKMGMNTVTLRILVKSRIPAPEYQWKVYVKKPGEADYNPNSSTTKPTTKPAGNTSKGTVKSSAIKPVTMRGLKVKRAGKKVKVSWTALTQKERIIANKVQVQYSRNKQFKGASTKTVNSKLTSYTSPKLKKGKYYVRVRAMRKSGNKKTYFKWTAAKSIKIK